MLAVRIEWDEAKRRKNLRDHGLDFADAQAVFQGFTASIEDARKDYGERRYLTFGLLQGRVVVIAHTERGQAIRVISMRKAVKHEQRSYFAQLPDGLFPPGRHEG